MKDFIALTKPGLVMMVVLTTCVGFYLGSIGPFDWLIIILNTYKKNFPALQNLLKSDW